MSELKPCPFCGGEAHTRTSVAFDRLHKWTVECNTEDCMGFFGCSFFEHEAEAIEAWNARYERTCIVLEEFGDDYVCDACGEVLRSGYDDPFEAIPLERFKYCFGCGAKVVE